MRNMRIGSQGKKLIRGETNNTVYLTYWKNNKTIYREPMSINLENNNVTFDLTSQGSAKSLSNTYVKDYFIVKGHLLAVSSSTNSTPNTSITLDQIIL